MGKSEKVKKANHRIPFYKEIIDESVAKSTTRFKIRNHPENHKATVIDHKLTKKILTEAQRQLDDLEEEVGLGSLCEDLQISHLYTGLPDEKIDYGESYEKENFQQENLLDESELYETHEDLDKKTALVDLLREKLTEKRTEIHTIFSDAGNLREVDERLSSPYKSVAQILSKYRSGKIPKYFKILPKLKEWEELLELTEPENWTAAAMFQATRIFSSNLNEEMAQRFYTRILLPRIRDEIAQCKRLNPHIYEAVKKAAYKPRAFVRGIVIPLCESGTCTKQEATILTSILSKTSVPSLHSSAVLLLISCMEYSDENCLFIRSLLEKKYALPFKAIDGIVDYFLKFAKVKEPQHVIWHQCLLTFVENYKNNFSQEQQQELLKLLKCQKHHKMSVKVRQELLSDICHSGEEPLNQ